MNACQMVFACGQHQQGAEAAVSTRRVDEIPDSDLVMKPAETAGEHYPLEPMDWLP